MPLLIPYFSFLLIMAWSYLLIPVSSALACWLVIRLVITMIFRNILPRRQSALAGTIGKTVATQFFSSDEIGKKITAPENLQKIMPMIETHIDDFLRNKLKKEMPIVGMFIGDKTIDSLKKVFLTELENLFPQVMQHYAANLAADLNIEGLVTKKINDISIKETEQLFRERFGADINRLSLFAALIGLVIGSFTMLILLFLR